MALDQDMARRVRSSSMTLKDFHDKTPGQASNGLPSKPANMGGCVHDAMDVESVESRFSDMSLSPFGGYGNYAHSDGQLSGSPYKGGNPGMSLSPYSTAGSKSADSWHAQRGYERPLGSYSRPARSDAPHDGEFASTPPPPPPRYSDGWSDERGLAKRSGSRTPDSEGHESSFHYDVHKLPSHEEYSYHNHYVSQTSPDVSAEETWKANGRSESGSGGGRPKLQLQPRSAPLPASGDAGAEPKQAAPGASGARPKLQLQPRSKPVENGGSRQSSLFGAARPREEILKDRGVDPVAVDAAPPPQLPVAPVAPAYSALAAPGAQAAPRQAGSDWQTVGPKRGQHSYDQGPGYLGSGGDLLLSRAAPSVPFYQSSYSPYDNGGYSGGYGQPQGRYSYGHGQDEADEGDPGFPGRRGLPTREDLF